MINIITTKDIPGYAEPCVIASIIHACKPSDLTRIVEHAIKIGHLKAILAGLPEEMQQLLNNGGRKEEESSSEGTFILTNPYDLTFQERLYYGKSGRCTAIKDADLLASKAPGTYKVIGLEYSVRSEFRMAMKEVENLEIVFRYP